jgi:hypothetical protein
MKAMRDRKLAAPDVEPLRSAPATSGLGTSGLGTVAIPCGAFVVASIAAATPASAHVKWFVTCDVSDDPLPLQAVFTGAFWLFSALYLALFYLACVIEDTRLGIYISGVLDRGTAALRERADVLLRAAAAVSFALLWADGSIILTPELRDNHPWLSTIQVLVALYLAARATLLAAAVAILVLYGYGVATYGLFHMLDYPFFLGLAAYFALSASKNARLGSFRFDCLRWTVALSLMWPSMENFLYPSWVAPIALAHPQITQGFDVATFLTALGDVEFGLTFALLWTPLVRRLAAAVLALMLTVVTLNLGKMDGMGHLMIVTILVLVFADPGRKQACCSPGIAPLVGGTALLAFIFLYSGAHALYYGPSDGAIVPLMASAALLTVGLLCLRNRGIVAAHASPVHTSSVHTSSARASPVMTITGPDCWRDDQGLADILTLDRSSRAAIARPMTRYESFVASLQAASPPSDHVPPAEASGSES